LAVDPPLIQHFILPKHLLTLKGLKLNQNGFSVTYFYNFLSAVFFIRIHVDGIPAFFQKQRVREPLTFLLDFRILGYPNSKILYLIESEFCLYSLNKTPEIHGIYKVEHIKVIYIRPN
jgi:hypothetical protein